MYDEDRDMQADQGDQAQEVTNGASDPQNEATAEAVSGAEVLPEEQLEEVARERDQFRAMAQRAQADLINFRRRMDEERQSLAQNATSQLLVRLLPVLDDFQRAADHLPADAPSTWSEGVHMVWRKLQSIMDGEGVTVFSPGPGTSFDPAEHEAVYFEPSDAYPQGCVLSTIRPGYRTANRVLRPAQVVLAQSQEEQRGA